MHRNVEWKRQSKPSQTPHNKGFNLLLFFCLQIYIDIIYFLQCPLYSIEEMVLKYVSFCEKTKTHHKIHITISISFSRRPCFVWSWLFINLQGKLSNHQKCTILFKYWNEMKLLRLFFCFPWVFFFFFSLRFICLKLLCRCTSFSCTVYTTHQHLSETFFSVVGCISFSLSFFLSVLFTLSLCQCVCVCVV